MLPNRVSNPGPLTMCMVNSFLPEVLCDCVSCRNSRQDEESHGQSQQEAIFCGQQSWREVRDPQI